MKFISSVLSRFSRKSSEAQQDAFDVRLQNMTARTKTRPAREARQSAPPVLFRRGAQHA
ncbi:MAG: hypothetical protein WAT77_12275 [Paracoccaceae bacterium]|jgi:hypothetical protein